MGAWGVLPFENDAALDWVTELKSRGVTAINDALESAAGDDYLDADDASAAVAAAATVAAARGEYRPMLPDELTAWLGSHNEDVSSELLDRAQRALESVMTSELRELREESAELDAWTQSVEETRSRLAGR